ncbi:MAG: T9SS type A sorting domain-containing protein, partial [Chitinophagaceae bacterium]|nr:T9SS type A sorting domain-containing protein [Chitinophagaceae bacterium]
IKSVYTVHSVVLANIYGQVLYTKREIEEKEFSIHTACKTPGIYILKMETDNGIQTTRFTIK